MTSQRFLCSLREFLTDQIEKRTQRRSVRKKRRDVPDVMQYLEKRMLLTTNVGVGREDSGDANNLLLQLLDNESLTGSRDETEEFSFHFGFSQNSDTDPGPGEVLQGYDDTILAGDFSGVGFDQIVTVRTSAGALQFLGDTDRDTTQEYLFKFGLDGFTPLIADMNGDGIDDAVVVDTSTTSNLLEWYVHYGVPGATPFPTDNSTVSTDATFSFGVDADHPDAGAGFADIPLVGDFNGDGRADVAAVRRNGGTYTWHIQNADPGANPYPSNTATVLPVFTFYNGYGFVGETPVVGDWDNDGDDNMGVVNASGGAGGTSRWHVDLNNSGGWDFNFDYGLPGDQYYVGNWADNQWNGNTDSNWATASNWSSGAAPTSSESVVIDQPDTAVTVTHSSGTAEAGSLVSREALNVSGGSLRLYADSQSTQSITVQSSGALRLDGVINAPGITVSTGAELGIGVNDATGSTPVTANHTSVI